MIRIFRLGKFRGTQRAHFLKNPVPRLMPADLIDDGVARQPQKITARFLGEFIEQFGLMRQARKKILQEVARIGLVAGEVKQIGVDRFGVVVPEGA